MTAHAPWIKLLAAAGAAAAGLSLAGCTGGPPGGGGPVAVAPGELRLVSFDSCEQALTDLRRALASLVGPYGLGGGHRRGVPAQEPGPPAGDTAAVPERAEQSAQQPEHSRTNTHEAGVDEPDLVKTDGRRIVSVVDGTLRVVDAASRQITGTLKLAEGASEADLLLSGDHALVIPRQQFAIMDGPFGEPVQPSPGPELILVDLTGAPKILARFSVDGRYVDARMVGQTVRVVVHSTPRLNFITPNGPGEEGAALRTNRDIVNRSTIEDLLPRLRLQTERGVSESRPDCAAVTRPAKYSAASMLTVLSFDLGAPSLGTGDPLTIVADGDIVYGTAGSLYVANDHSRAIPMSDGPEPLPMPEPMTGTELYKFDTSAPGRPRYAGAGSVPGVLLNQYSLSEYAGRLRVATTEHGQGRENPPESAVYVLEQRGDKLAVAGRVGGLGKGERIYAVRFTGPVGYVVTFRETDPLYTLDLRDPAAPRVAGELKITGYSAYLHPAGEHRVIGVGQEATEQGRRTGTQVSMFDVSDPAKPTRVAQYQMPGTHSEVEYDPHAFLYWAATRTLVLPVLTDRGGSAPAAIVLRVADGALTEVGEVRHRTASAGYGGVRRALVIGTELWTLSAGGLSVNETGTLADRGWVAFG